jgi:CRP-like cAMP-binding protein
MPHRSNFLLNQLSPALLQSITPHLTVVALHHAEVLARTHELVEKVYFPHSGIISCVVELGDGGAIETGLIGSDGEFGAGHALDDKVSLNHVVIQVAGVASVINTYRLRELADRHPLFRKLLINYEQFFLAQVQQTAACNAVHSVQARTCKWFLRMHDLVGADLMLTQEFIAQMMGVRRTSITEVASGLQKAGLISYRRAHIHIHDLEGIKNSACGCNDDLRSHYRLMFGSHDGNPDPASMAARHTAALYDGRH